MSKRAKTNSTYEKLGRFSALPHSVFKSIHYKRLRSPEAKLLIDICLQYNGYNNGTLSACHTLMKEYGWAKSSLYRAFNKLVHAGFIVVTRQGIKQRGYPTLVAITWLGIDEARKNVVYDDRIFPNRTPLNYWCKRKQGWEIQPNRKEIL